MSTESAALIAVASVQALATIVLVGVTWTYAQSSRRHADAAMETARLARESVLNMFRPVTTVSVQPFRSGDVPYLTLYLKNDGLGRAAITSVECRMGPQLTRLSQQGEVFGAFLDVGAETPLVFNLPATGPYGDCVASVGYRDVFNRTFRTTHKFSLNLDDKGRLLYTFESEEQELIEESSPA